MSFSPPHAGGTSASHPSAMIRSRATLLMPVLAALVLGITGCGASSAPPPSAQQAVEEFRGQVAERVDQMGGVPAAAAKELGLLIESLEGYAATHGEPFTGWLAKAREVQAAWGTAPSRQQVAQGVEMLQQAIGE